MQEEIFPRGGSASAVAKKAEDDIKTTDYLFEIPDEAKRITKKKKKSKKKDESNQDEDMVANITTLSKKNLSVGSLVLGIISEIHEYTLRLSLPNGLSGSVEVTGVSQAYSEELHGMVAGDAECEPAPLSKIFMVGQMLPCSVVKVAPRILLTLNPAVVNQDLRPAHLHPGRSIMVAVQSAEDHGYVLETGVPCLALGGTLTGFMPLSVSSNLAVGQLVECQVQKPPEGRTVKLTFASSNPSPVVPETPLVALLPGTVIEFTVTRVEALHGIYGQMGTLSVCVHRHHCWHPPTHYHVGKKVQGTVLYIHDYTRQVYVRLGSRELSTALQSIKSGKEVNGTVESLTSNAVYLQLPNSIKALATKNLLSDDKEDFEIAQKFRVGGTHKCRVLSIDLVERMAKVTLKPSALRKPYIDYQNIKAGDHFKGVRVEEQKPFGLIVRIDAHMTGIIRTIFLSDHPTSKSLDRYPVGSKLSCRVVEVKPTVNLPKLLLTSQKSWLSWTGKIPQSLEELEPGMDLPGTIAQVTPAGLLVVTYSGIQGWVPSRKTGVPNPASHFTVGQFVRFTVLACDADSKLIFTLVKEKKKPKVVTPLLQAGENVDQAKVVSCSDDRLMLETNSGAKAQLPLSHLSDHSELCQPLMKILQQPGTQISNLRCFRGGHKNPVLTRKASLLRANKLNVTFESLSVGQVLPGVVRGSTPFNTFVDLGAGFVAMAPKKNVGAGQTEAGLSVEAHITNLDEKKSQALVSLQLTAVWQRGHAGPSVLYLASYLADLMMLPGPHPGHIVSVTVDSLTKTLARCKLEDGRPVTALLPLQAPPKKGDTVQGLVLASEPELEVCIDQNIIRKVIHAAQLQDKSQAVKEGQVIKCQALTIQPKYVLALLGGHVAGKLVFIPTRRHPNDVVGREKLYVVGDSYHVVVKRVADSYVVGVLKQHDKDLQARIKAQKEAEVAKLKKKKKRKVSIDEEEEQDVIEVQSPPKKKLKEDNPEKEEKVTAKSEKSAAPPSWAEDLAHLLQIPDLDMAMDSEEEDEMEEEEEIPEETVGGSQQMEGALKWLQKMAEAMDRGDVNKARSEGRKGVNLVQSNKDKLDLWLALVNLELLQDSESNAEAIAQEALQHCEPLPLLTGLLRVYSSSGYKEMAKAAAESLLRKCRNSKQAWLQVIQYYMSNGDLEAARGLKQRYQSCLTKKEYVEVVTKMGQLEFQYGDPEQGKTIIEAVLAYIPGRADVANLYMQLLAKHGHLDYAKQLSNKLDSMPISQKRKEALRKRLEELFLSHSKQEA